jgi:hypothetical protein
MLVILLQNGKNQEFWRKMMNKRITLISLLLMSVFLVENAPQVGSNKIDNSLKYKTRVTTYFNATRAYNLIEAQVAYGPRIPGSIAIENVRNLVVQTLENGDDWQVEFQNFSKIWMGDVNISLVNIICTPAGIDLNQPFFLLLAHYDTRIIADKDPDPNLRIQPVLGANDGASGVAVALELGMVLRKHHNMSNFRIILFDAEDQGNTGWNWIIGSRYFVSSGRLNLSEVSFAILFDMVGGMNPKFKREGYSNQYSNALVNDIWNTAHYLNYEEFFINKSWSKITDDHLPFLEQGVTAVDIIDDFTRNNHTWHTSHDTIDQISINTLEAVGKTVETFLSNFAFLSSSYPTFTAFTFKPSIKLIFVIFPLFLLAILRFSKPK